ncbi:ribonuclease H2, subunit C [Phellopilus nigrolimitatus]|nr:ribonuclease H2, subunit C [Phellopilus nigrolimitatus]
MSAPKLKLSVPEPLLAPCSPGPQLMPFHVAYSGPAPITTFFRVQEVDEKKSGGPSSSRSTITDENTKENTNFDQSLTVRVRKRLAAAFRGRRMIGLEVPLPAGYTGVVLRSDAPGKPSGQSQVEKKKGKETNGKAKANSARKPSARRTRRSKTVEEDKAEKGDEPPMDMMELDDSRQDLMTCADNEEGETRTLKLTQRFASLIVWNPDIVVDEGRDEYIRALNEWTSLAAEIHKVED